MTMPNYNIDRQNFLSIIDQFKGDIPFLHKLFDKLSKVIPEEYYKQLIADAFHNFVYDEPYYVAEHYLFTGEKHYFRSLEELVLFLEDRNIEKEYPVKKNKVQMAMNSRLPIAGFVVSYIEKEKVL